MATPNWIGATNQQPPLAAQINQLVGTHAATYVYQGTEFSQSIGTSAGTVNSNGLYLAQQFTTSASTTAVGRIAPAMTVTGVPPPATVSIQANVSSAPSGTPLVTTVIPPNWGNATAAYQSIPLPVTGLAASTTYWLVLNAVGDASNFYTFLKSTVASGASTSTNGTTWTAQAYGFLYVAYDQTPGGSLTHTWEDSGARISYLSANSDSTPGAIEEYTVAQGANQFVYSYRVYGYSNNRVVSIT